MKVNKSPLSGENESGFQKNGINQLSENNLENSAVRLKCLPKRILTRLSRLTFIKLITFIKIILKMNYAFY